MKIINDKVVYVQKIDLEFLKYRLHSLPVSIDSQIFENVESNFDDFNKYDFFKFENVNDIEFFRNTDFIVDYNFVKTVSIDEIVKVGKKYIEKRDILARKLYSIATSNSDYNEILTQFKIVEYQISSLNDIIDFKSGCLKMKLPEGTELPAEFMQENGFRKLIKIMFNKRSS